MAKLTKGTVKDFPGFDARADAEVCRNAMKGLGTDEESLMKVLIHRSNRQRQEIAADFKTLFGRDMTADLKSELTGNFERLMVSLMRDARLFDAHALKHALKAGTTHLEANSSLGMQSDEFLGTVANAHLEPQ